MRLKPRTDRAKDTSGSGPRMTAREITRSIYKGKSPQGNEFSVESLDTATGGRFPAMSGTQTDSGSRETKKSARQRGGLWLYRQGERCRPDLQPALWLRSDRHIFRRQAHTDFRDQSRRVATDDLLYIRDGNRIFFSNLVEDPCA